MYNVEAAIENLIFTKEDTIDLSFSVSVNGESCDMSEGQLDLLVYTDVVGDNGEVYRSFSSGGDSPDITILTNIVTIYSLTGFPTVKRYQYGLKFTNGSGETFTIMKGSVIVER